MATFNSGKREVGVKLVYYGAGLAGKTRRLIESCINKTARAASQP